jgi:tetratricopeptide (TPR) repeat protein
MPLVEQSAALPLSAQAAAPSGVEAPARGVDKLLHSDQMPEQPARTAVEPDGSRASAGPIAAPRRRSVAGTLLRLLFVLIAIAVAGGLSFFGGRSYQRQIDLEKAAATVLPGDPKGALLRMSGENNGKPLDSTDPEFLYLYGRALMLNGKHAEAQAAFLKALEIIKDAPPHDPLKVEAQISTLVAAFKAFNFPAARSASAELDKMIQADETTTTAAGPEAQPSASPPVAPGSSNTPATSETNLPAP